MTRVGIVGVSGYSGLIALKLLLKHPDVRLTYVSANTTTGKVGEIWPQLFGQTKLECVKFDAAEAAQKCDLVFLAVPHKISMEIAPLLLKKGLKVIDLSGDYRLKNTRLYKQWYGTDHIDPLNLKYAIYGLPELFRVKIKKASFIANPGCYPTAALLGLAPVVSIYTPLIEQIVIDAKSGVSGAGKKASIDLTFCEVNESFKAYKVLQHQHSPEIETYLKKISAGSEFDFNFVAHLLPINQGILETIYVHLKEKISLSELHKIYKRFYHSDTFVRVLELGTQPELKNVVNTNFCDIGMAQSANGKLLVITSVIDNLYKGAASQAVQNMNIICGFNETIGIL
ncbi:MAG: N-acetyl-gamma-glutamyl-phosphate reductase [Candidatus Omnitrophica bacterium]|nr:N-acetyl-gamma-glutamyl-phosphate reductase [Candidatus Omnitrophota bacterium]